MLPLADVIVENIDASNATSGTGKFTKDVVWLAGLPAAMTRVFCVLLEELNNSFLSQKYPKGISHPQLGRLLETRNIIPHFSEQIRRLATASSSLEYPLRSIQMNAYMHLVTFCSDAPGILCTLPDFTRLNPSTFGRDDCTFPELEQLIIETLHSTITILDDYVASLFALLTAASTYKIPEFPSGASSELPRILGDVGLAMTSLSSKPCSHLPRTFREGLWVLPFIDAFLIPLERACERARNESFGDSVALDIFGHTGIFFGEIMHSICQPSEGTKGTHDVVLGDAFYQRMTRFDRAVNFYKIAPDAEAPYTESSINVEFLLIPQLSSSFLLALLEAIRATENKNDSGQQSSRGSGIAFHRKLAKCISTGAIVWNRLLSDRNGDITLSRYLTQIFAALHHVGALIEKLPAPDTAEGAIAMLRASERLSAMACSGKYPGILNEAKFMHRKGEILPFFAALEASSIFASAGLKGACEVMAAGDVSGSKMEEIMEVFRLVLDAAEASAAVFCSLSEEARAVIFSSSPGLTASPVEVTKACTRNIMKTLDNALHGLFMFSETENRSNGLIFPTTKQKR